VSAIIEVEHLTKFYGKRLALDAATFAVQPGQIVGFLGPNGAGKSTTLRILTGFMPATSGTARVAGHDVLLESLAVRSSIGYMPENVPLYPEMRVEDYLKLRAGLKDVPRRERRKAVDGVIERCWLQERRRSLIGTLSKGLRQRVGLAESLVADPKVLILDEPTIGLDPVQIQETRKLVRSLGEKHTVLLSSHHLSEVEKTCSHVVIIADGRIKASGSVEALREGLAQRYRIVLELKAGKSSDGPAEITRALAQVQAASVQHEDTGDGWTRFMVTPASQADPREALYALVVQRGWLLREMRRQVPSLEELYVQITEGSANHAAAADKGAA
jgi:ABC-2 type transport system ATP-binding protein